MTNTVSRSIAGDPVAGVNRVAFEVIERDRERRIADLAVSTSDPASCSVVSLRNARTNPTSPPPFTRDDVITATIGDPGDEVRPCSRHPVHGVCWTPDEGSNAMPRKQRFKPSRKPKPVEAKIEQGTTQIPRDDRPPVEPAHQDVGGHGDVIETATAPRSRDDTSAVIEDVGSEVR
jgi:hypothetical protein